MANPFVTMLAHPTGRLLLKREAYAVDIPAVLDAAAETGTWIEINAAPKRLDLDWRWWPLAKEKGVKCVINPDAHRSRAFAGLVVRHRRRAQRLADQRRCDELFAGWTKIENGDKSESAREFRLRHLFPLRQKHGQTFAGAAGLEEFRHRQCVAAIATVVRVLTRFGAPSGSTISRSSTTALQEKCILLPLLRHRSNPARGREWRAAHIRQTPPETRPHRHRAADKSRCRDGKNADRPARPK